jgi:hypothetical protein
MPAIPPKEHQFKKGQPSPNPLGRKLQDPAMRKLAKLTKEELVEVGSLILKGEIKNLKKLAVDTEATVLQRMVASVAVRIMGKGDMHALDLLLNRLIGKVKEEVEITGDLNQTSNLSDERLEEILLEIKAGENEKKEV